VNPGGGRSGQLGGGCYSYIALTMSFLTCSPLVAPFVYSPQHLLYSNSWGRLISSTVDEKENFFLVAQSGQTIVPLPLTDRSGEHGTAARIRFKDCGKFGGVAEPVTKTELGADRLSRVGKRSKASFLRVSFGYGVAKIERTAITCLDRASELAGGFLDRFRANVEGRIVVEFVLLS
jgi:hypothetical protein